MKNLLFILVAFMMLSACSQNSSNTNEDVNEEANVEETNVEKTEAEKLGFEKGKKVLILHADDAGMSPEANEAIIEILSNGHIQSAAVMAPCPGFEDFINWAKANPGVDVGMHLTHTSEWKTYRWGPVSDPGKIPGLIDPDGKFWHEVPGVVQHASAEEVEIETRAQIEAAIALGWNPTHMDTHMGTLYGSQDYVAVFTKVAEEYGIPANIINLSTLKLFIGSDKLAILLLMKLSL